MRVLLFYCYLILFRFEKNTITVYVGRLIKTGPNFNEVSRSVSEIQCHESYDLLTNEHDICLVKLDSPVDFTNYIRPICLPTSNSTFYTGTSTWVTGWGNTDPDGKLWCGRVKQRHDDGWLLWLLVPSIQSVRRTAGGQSTCGGKQWVSVSAVVSDHRVHDLCWNQWGRERCLSGDHHCFYMKCSVDQ